MKATITLAAESLEALQKAFGDLFPPTMTAVAHGFDAWSGPLDELVTITKERLAAEGFTMTVAETQKGQPDVNNVPKQRRIAGNGGWDAGTRK